MQSLQKTLFAARHICRLLGFAHKEMLKPLLFGSMSAWETVHEVCSPPLRLPSVTTQARRKSFFFTFFLQSCQDPVLGDKDGVLFLTERRVLSLADPYLPEERQIASPSNCAQQRQKLPTLWSRATRYHTVPHAPIHARIHLDPAGEKE